MFELPSPVLEIDRVTVQMNDRVLVRDFSVSLYPGEILFLVGSSGAGKSTALKLAAGLTKPRHGLVKANAGDGEVALHDLRPQDLTAFRRRHFGYVRQNALETLDLSQSVGANIAQPLFENGVRDFSVAMTEVRHWCNALDLDVTRLNEKPSAFSGGMLQRVQVARAMIHRPRIILLDEPTTGLDSAVQSTLLTLLLDLQRKSQVAMIFVTHDLRIARLMAHRILVLDGGEIVEEAPPDRLIADPQHQATKRLVGAMI